MVKVEIKTVKLSQIKLNPDNPRRIGNVEMDRLVKSLQDFPEQSMGRAPRNVLLLWGAFGRLSLP